MKPGNNTAQTPLLVAKGAPLLPGKMYLRLYHGRTDPDQQMEDWGFDSPTFGPLACYVHTYCCTFRIHGESIHDEIWLETHNDMIRWDGCFYGDMELFIAAATEESQGAGSGRRGADVQRGLRRYSWRSAVSGP